MSPSRAAPNAPPKSPSAGTSIGRFSTFAMISSQAREREPPPTAVARSTLVPAAFSASRQSANANATPSMTARASAARSVSWREADEAAPRACVVVRCPLAGEIGQEEERLFARRRLRDEPVELHRRSMPVMPASHSSEAAAERIDAHLVPRASGAHGRTRARRSQGSGGISRWRRKARPTCRARRTLQPGATVPTPQADAALSPAPPAMTGADAIPQRVASVCRSFPVGSVPSRSAGI